MGGKGRMSGRKGEKAFMYEFKVGWCPDRAVFSSAVFEKHRPECPLMEKNTNMCVWFGTMVTS